MGNVCCGNKQENHKASAFQSTENDTLEREALNHATRPTTADSLAAISTVPINLSSANDNNNKTDPLEAAQIQALREEETRLQVILQTAGRGMVAVRSTRGSTAYYDQGFAAALGQHLEQTTQFPEQLPTQLPQSSSSSTSTLAQLSQPPWQDVQLGDKDGLAGCAGENPQTYFDQKAQAFLDQARPKKEQLFVGLSPMVENLL